MTTCQSDLGNTLTEAPPDNSGYVKLTAATNLDTYQQPHKMVGTLGVVLEMTVVPVDSLMEEYERDWTSSSIPLQ